MILNYFEDNQYPQAPIQHVRNAVRCFVMNSQGQCAMIHIKGYDIFGERDHYESSGGGIEPGESMEQAIHREIQEELGLEVVVGNYLGSVVDEYHLLHRTTVQNYFICYATKKTHFSRTRLETELFNGIIWKFPEQWLECLMLPQKGVNELIYARERMMMRLLVDQQGKLPD